jgi:superoxide reductase
MTAINQIFKCSICGNIVELVHSGADSLVCCGQPMELQTEKSLDEGNEKHKPVVDGKIVKVGSVPHPMEEAHHIEWIESVNGMDICRKDLKVGDQPEAEFCEEVKSARAYCNVHGLWKS